jgi:predicted ArsR family transcriptional regulator
MTQTSRQQIIETLQKKGKASVSELAESLGLTTVTIRHHLAILIEAGIVSPPTKRKKPGRGRPEMLYHLGEDIHEFLPSDLAFLGINLVDTLEDTLKPDEFRALLRRAGEHAAAAAGLTVKVPPADQAERAMAYLNAHGYLAAVGSRNGKPRMVLSNCPYYQLARRVPTLCLYDLALMERALDLPMRLESRINQGDPSCAFGFRRVS